MKAPGNYFDQFRSNKISALLCEGPKPNISMISEFSGPVGPLTVFIDLNVPNYFKTYEKIWKHFRKYCLYKSQIWVNKLEFLDHIWKIRAPKIMKIRLIQSRKSWILDQSPPENMKWKFGTFLKPRNHKTIKT